MKRLACCALLCILPSVFPAVALSQPASSIHLGKRHKSTAVSLRGVVSNLHSGTFTLNTRTRGSFLVNTKAATSVSEKGSAGRTSIHSGDHVSVRGFLHGRKMLAIRIRIFPTKPKAFSVKGTITSRSLNQIVIVGSGKTTRAQLTNTTQIRRGNQPGTARQIGSGDRIDARLQFRNHVLVVLRIHIYAVRAAKKHVRLHGTVFRSSRTSISIRSGGRTVVVALTKTTRVYVGSALATAASLESGETVTIYACCAAHPLSAFSIHIRKTRALHKAALIRGRVTTASRTTITISTSSGNISALLIPSTVFELGSLRIPPGNVRAEDQVSIRGFYSHGRFEASRVHIFAASRRTRTFTGTVVSSTTASVTILSRGRQYRLSVNSKTTITLNGKPSHSSSLHAGDRIRVRARPESNGLLAVQATVKRPLKKLKLISVRGTLRKVEHTRLIVLDGFGLKHEIRIPAGVHIRWHGKDASPDAVFVGAAISARGLVIKGVLVAKTLTLSVKSRKVEGRVITVTRSVVVLLLRNRREVTVQLLKGAKVNDAGRIKSWSAIHKDAYLQATGYVQPSQALRTSKAEILHPLLDLTAIVLSSASGLLVQTATKDQFRLAFLPTTQFSTGGAQVIMSRADIPPGTHLRFTGKVNSDGSVSLISLALRLTKITVRGFITGIEGQDLRTQGSTGSLQIKIQSLTLIDQGSRTLQLTDLVVHDDVTVYGYSGGPGIVFARKVSVHRKLVGLTGTVESVTSGSFALAAADGSHRILFGTSVIFSGGSVSDITTGKSLHVTGYRRGDESILATRITFKKSKKIKPTPNGSSPIAHVMAHQGVLLRTVRISFRAIDSLLIRRYAAHRLTNHRSVVEGTLAIIPTQVGRL